MNPELEKIKEEYFDTYDTCLDKNKERSINVNELMEKCFESGQKAERERMDKIIKERIDLWNENCKEENHHPYGTCECKTSVDALEDLLSQLTPQKEEK